MFYTSYWRFLFRNKQVDILTSSLHRKQSFNSFFWISIFDLVGFVCMKQKPS